MKDLETSKGSKRTISIEPTKPVLPLKEKTKIDKFNESVKESLNKRQKENEDQKKENAAFKKNPKTFDVSSKNKEAFEDLKKEFKKTIFHDFIDQIKKNNFVFGFQLDSETRVDYGKQLLLDLTH
jgi:hypothetical protein